MHPTLTWQRLSSGASFRRLPPDEQRRVAADLEQILGFLSDGRPLAFGSPQAPAEIGKKSLGDTAGQVGDLVDRIVDAVDFPSFVSSLVEGVFTSIVNSSIKQMEAYAQLLATVVKSVEQFADDHIPDSDANGYLVSQFPGLLQTGGPGGGLQLTPNGLTNPPNFARLFNTPNTSYDLNTPDGRAQILTNARLSLARSRQQQLATMVLMGINRIVVTDGRINAKVQIDVNATEKVSSKATASRDTSDSRTEDKTQKSRSIWGTSSTDTRTITTSVVTSKASSSAQSDAMLEAKAKLTGEVDIRFKSETFPLEKLAPPDQISTINRNANPAQATPTPTGVQPGVPTPMAVPR